MGSWRKAESSKLAQNYRYGYQVRHRFAGNNTCRQSDLSGPRCLNATDMGGIRHDRRFGYR
jgi:hypothetical protein